MESTKTGVSRILRPVLGVLVALSITAASPEAGGAPRGYVLAKELRDNVVTVVAEWENGETQSGFGFIVGEKTGQLYISTANHVVRGIGPDAKAARVEVEFHDRQGEPFEAKLLGTSSADRDLAVLRAPLPQGLSWRKDVLSDVDAQPLMSVWFVGRLGKWYVPSIAGIVNRIELDDRIVAENLKVLPGTSGAPLIAEGGVIGMIVSDAPGEVTHALTLSVIRRAFEIWKHPWQLVKLEPPPPDITGTYTGPGLIVASNCSNESDNGPGNYSAVVNISQQSGNKFSSDLIFRSPYYGYEVAIDLAGTVTAGGKLNGGVEYQVFRQGAPVSRGNGTFTGEVIDDVLSLKANVQDTIGDTCTAGVTVTARRQ